VDTVQTRVPANLDVSGLAGQARSGRTIVDDRSLEIRAASILLAKQVLELDASWLGREL
jgi:hypothetical protein